MFKHLKVILLVLVMTPFLSVPQVKGIDTSGPFLIDTTTSDDALLINPVQGKTFWSNGRYWAFFGKIIANCQGVSGSNKCLHYSSSLDGQSWSASVSVNKTAAASGVSVHFKDSSVFYARYNSTTIFTGGDSKGLFFAQGTLLSGGTISFQSEVLVKSAVTNITYQYPVIRVSASSQAFITFKRDNRTTGGLDYPFVINSQGTDYNTWVGETQLVTFSITSGASFRVSLTALTNGKMYVTYHTTSISLRGREWNSGWGNEEQIAPEADNEGEHAFTFAEQDTVHLLYQKSPSNELMYQTRVGTNSWSTPEVITTDSVSTLWGASYDSTEKKFYAFSFDFNNDIIYLYVGKSGSWEPRQLLFSPTILSSQGFTAFIHSQNNAIGFMWTENSVSPFNIKIAFVNIPLPSGGAGFPSGGAGGDEEILILLVSIFLGGNPLKEGTLAFYTNNDQLLLAKLIIDGKVQTSILPGNYTLRTFDSTGIERDVRQISLINSSEITIILEQPSIVTFNQNAIFLVIGLIVMSIFSLSFLRSKPKVPKRNKAKKQWKRFLKK